MQLAILLIVIAILLALPSIVYIAKHPQAKGEPPGRTRILMWVSYLLSFCCMVAAASVLFFSR